MALSGSQENTNLNKLKHDLSLNLTAKQELKEKVGRLTQVPVVVLGPGSFGSSEYSQNP